MFGNILIDKIRISRKLDFDFQPKQAQQELSNLLSKHFRSNNYTVNYSKCYFRVTFTPTLYQDTIVEDDTTPILNLEMMPAENLVTLLTQIYSILGDKAVVTWLDLAKNIITEKPAFEYTKALAKCKAKYPYKLDECTSQVKVGTTTFGTQTRENKAECKKGERQIDAYDKIAQIQIKTKGKVRFVDNVKLTDAEIIQLPKVNYQKDIERLFLKDLHILRIEQRYKYTRQNKRITHFLTDSSSEDKLTIPLLINLLKNNELYGKLDEFYTNELRTYIFYDDIDKAKNTPVNNYQQMIIDIVKDFDINLLEYQGLYTEIGFKDRFNDLMRLIQPKTRDSYYEELYHKLNI